MRSNSIVRAWKDVAQPGAADTVVRAYNSPGFAWFVVCAGPAVANNVLPRCF